MLRPLDEQIEELLQPMELLAPPPPEEDDGDQADDGESVDDAAALTPEEDPGQTQKKPKKKKPKKKKPKKKKPPPKKVKKKTTGTTSQGPEPEPEPQPGPKRRRPEKKAKPAEGDDEEWVEQSCCATVQHCDDGATLRVHAKFPQAGRYRLTVLAGKDTKKSSFSYSSTVTYLIEVVGATVGDIPAQLGRAFHANGLGLVNHTQQTIDHSSPEPLSVSFRCPSGTDTLVSLELVGEEAEEPGEKQSKDESKFEEHTMVQRGADESLQVLATFPQPGTYNLSLWARPELRGKRASSSFSSKAVQFEVIVVSSSPANVLSRRAAFLTPSRVVQPPAGVGSRFPRVFADMSEVEGFLLSPMSRTLAAGRAHEFSLILTEKRPSKLSLQLLGEWVQELAAEPAEQPGRFRHSGRLEIPAETEPGEGQLRIARQTDPRGKYRFLAEWAVVHEPQPEPDPENVSEPELEPEPVAGELLEEEAAVEAEADADAAEAAAAGDDATGAE